LPHWIETQTGITSGKNSMTALHHNTLSRRSKKPSPRLLAYGFYIVGVLAALIAAVVQVSAQA